MALLLPVCRKGEEVIVLKIHHGTEHIHYALLQPGLRLLVNRAPCRPSTGRIAAHIGMLAHGATAQTHPRLHLLYFIVYGADHLGHVSSSPIGLVLFLAIFAISGAVGKTFCLLGITDIIQMDAVDIVI